MDDYYVAYPMYPEQLDQPQEPSNEQSLKSGAGKTRWDIVPWEIIKTVAEIITDGAEKYSDYGWQEVGDAEDVYFAAAMRHLTTWRLGTQNDEESGKPHLAHAICNLIFCLWHSTKGEE